MYCKGKNYSMTNERIIDIDTLFFSNDIEGLKEIDLKQFFIYYRTLELSIDREQSLKQYAKAHKITLKSLRGDLDVFLKPFILEMERKEEELNFLQREANSIKINEIVLKSLTNHIFFFKSGKEIVVVTPNSKELKSLPHEKALKLWIIDNFNIFLHKPSLDPTIRKEQKKDETAFLDNHIVKLIIINQFSILHYSRDPFSNTPKILRDDHKLHYTAPFFYMKPYVDKFNTPVEKKREIIEDYKNHFSQFDDFLEWTIANRFTNNRRTSYTYLRVGAGFGKSLLSSFFSDLGVGRKVVQQQLKPNSAGDLTPMEFRNSFILMIDEFTHFGQELKDMTHGMSLSAKFQLSEYVPLYAKVFLSAEKSTSFFGDAGVDAQLADRVSVLDLSDNGKIGDRKLYRENTLLYSEVLKEYVYNFFRSKADYYISLGELEANRISNDVLDLHFNKYKVEADTIEKIREKCLDYLKDFLEWSEKVNSFGDKFKHSFFEKLEKNVFIRNENEIVTNDITKMYETLISEAGEQFAKTAKFKQTMLDEVFKVSLEKKVRRTKMGCKRGVLINISALEKKDDEIQTEFKDINGALITEEEFMKKTNRL